MKINAIDIKPGNVLEHQGRLWVVLKRELVQPGKGGAFAQVEMRDLRAGTKLNERFRTQETVERARLDEKEMQFLFMEGDQATFMDSDNYEQIAVPRETIGDPADFLSDGMVCTIMLHEGAPLSVTLPPSVVMRVEPGARLQCRRFDLDKAAIGEKPAQCFEDPGAPFEPAAAQRKALGPPPVRPLALLVAAATAHLC